jgi:Predicted HD phosphohydrolase
LDGRLRLNAKKGPFCHNLKNSEVIMGKQATFSEMKNGTAEDYAIIAEQGSKHASELPNRIMDHLNLLKGDTGGFAVDRFTHSIQTATRAHRDGRDEEYVVCALLHDIGDSIASANHADLAATMLEPFVSDKNYWIVKHHGIFQGYYFFEHMGLDKNMRDQFKGHEYWNDCVEFCAKYDQNSFDPEYENLPIEEFIPMVHNVFAKPRDSIYKRRDY